MKKYLLLKTQKENYPYIVDVLKMLLGWNIQVEEGHQLLKIECLSVDEKELCSTIQSLEADLNSLISYYLTSTSSPEYETELVFDIFLNLEYGHYQFKEVIPYVRKKALALELFHFIVEGTGVTEDIIMAMADCDLNVSKASSKLFMHRNTLLYKIERLESLKGFDLKHFNDLYLLVQLLKA
ncbi:MAG: helix-turn-helix domain-containing protein [Anaeroplasmataceae bacterium]|nr:helix-turn-helix domain-containing protein [Anaeroplasmataceae bacterium]